MNQTYTVNTGVSSTVNIQLATTQSTSPASSIGSVAVASTSVAPVAGPLSLVNVQGAPATTTASATTVNSITGTVQKASLASPALTITAPGQTNLASPATLTLTAPAGVTPSSLCVASYNDSTGTMTCQPTTVTKRDSNANSLSTQFTQLGTYALIFKPTCQVDATQDATSFCATRNWAPLATGYYCADNGRKFYQCWGSQGALLSCSSGTTCRCCSSDECSVGNTISPCI